MSLFIFRKRFWLLILKALTLAFVGGMLLIHLPEMGYDLGPKTPLLIDSVEDLAPDRFKGPTFVSIGGRPDFSHGFIYKRYGLSYTYFNVQPYGFSLVVRTHDKVTDEWKQLNRFVGRLRPFDDQPFSYKIRAIYDERFDADIPDEAYFMALGDVPKLSGWQVGAMIFASVLWLVLFYFFFIFRWGGKKKEAS